MKKKRASREELKKAYQFAREQMVQKGIIKSTEESIIQNILETKDAPILPGTPARLPYPWVINATKRVVRDLCAMWLNDLKKKEEKDDFVKFTEFAFKEMANVKKLVESLVKDSGKNKEYDFKYWHRKESLDSIQWLITEALAVSIIVKENNSTAQFLEWFGDWTEKMKSYWPESVRNIDGAQRTNQAGIILPSLYNKAR